MAGEDKIELVKNLLLEALRNRDTGDVKIGINQGGIVKVYYDKKII